MKYLIILACAVFISKAGITQQLVDDANAVERNVTSFHAIEVSDGIDLYLTQGNEEALAVSASKPEYRDKIIAEVKDGVLKIYFDHAHFNWNWSDRKMMRKAYVSFKKLDDLQAGGGSDVYAKGGINSGSLTVHISGGSDFHGAVTTSNLQMKASGGSDIFVTGTASSLSIEASGGSDFHGYDLTTNSCDINASGGSDVEITANKEMNIEASGGSDVRYKGTGTIKSMNNSGSSDIKKVN